MTYDFPLRILWLFGTGLVILHLTFSFTDLPLPVLGFRRTNIPAKIAVYEIRRLQINQSFNFDTKMKKHIQLSTKRTKIEEHSCVHR